jgi:hypothetical protein
VIKSLIREDTDNFIELGIKVIEVISGVYYKKDDSVLFVWFKIAKDIRKWFGHNETIPFGDPENASLEPQFS